jgi:hypothetical protein
MTIDSVRDGIVFIRTLADRLTNSNTDAERDAAAENLQGLKERLWNIEEFGALVSSWTGPDQPAPDDEIPERCFGVAYSPGHRTIMTDGGTRIANPAYDATDDPCGRHCPYGLPKRTDSLQEDEVQGSGSCLLLGLFSSLFDVPLPPKELGGQADKLRLTLAETLPSILQALNEEEEPKEEPMSTPYVLKPNDQVHQGYVYSHDTKDYVRNPDGSLVTEAQVQTAPPPAPPTPPAPPAPMPPTAAVATPQPAPAPQPAPTPVPTPAAPQPTPGEPITPPSGLPPTPQLPQMPVQPAPTTAEVVTTPPAEVPKPPAVKETLPPVAAVTTDPGVSVADIIDAAKDALMSATVDNINAVFEQLKVDLGDGEATPPTEGVRDTPKTTPQPTAGDKIEESDEEPPSFDTDDPVEIFKIQYEKDKFASMNRETFKQLIVNLSTADQCHEMAEIIGTELTVKPSSNASRSTRTALTRAIYGQSGSASILE